MKYARQLQRRAILEWQPYYYDYKGGKKRIKAIQKALKDLPRRNENGESNERSPLATDRPDRYGTSSPPTTRSLRLPRPALRSRRSEATTESLFHPNTATEEYKVYRLREVEFRDALDHELAKIEQFHTAKEEEAKKDIEVIRAQLDIYRRYRPQQGSVYSTAMRRIGGWEPTGAQRDYSRREHDQVPHHYAKRQLKDALAEIHRGLEMIKAYSLDNEEAFRKIVKKYNKNVASITGTRSTYLDDRVRKANFVTSQEIQNLMDETEDLYAEHFEKGVRKLAARKLRTKTEQPGDQTGAAVRATAFTCIGTIFAIQGLSYGLLEITHRSQNDPQRTNTEYLLQLYGGQFLMIFLGLLFSLCVSMFQRFKVNYAFIFELDKQTALHWQELAEIPSWFLFIMGLVMYLNLAIHAGGDTMYVYWPIISVGLMVVIFLLPSQIGLPYFRARMWLLATLGRLLFSGASRVGFGEFFMGDLLCSLTYTMGNIELFACLYARHWHGIEQCNSSHSRALGFLSALPGVFRALQCLRRAGLPWRKNFSPKPHLYNFAKYCATIGQYVTLSVYRIDKTGSALAAFCVLASVNTIYCILWDVLYDWSLATDYRKKIYPLRSILVYKQRWPYLVAMPVDAILRCNWIPYAIWTQDAQHSSFVSFMVALSEVLRRSLWVLFRVENEQATNTEQALAFKIRRLPYHLESTPRTSTESHATTPRVDGTTESSTAERQSPAVSTLQRFGSEIRAAHKRDYVKRKPAGWEDDSEDED